MKKSFFLFLLFFIFVAPVYASDEDKAMVRITSFHESLIAMMKGKAGASFESRFIFLDPIISEVFHIPTMAGVASGRYGREASDEQRANFEEVFRAFTTSNYISNFKTWDNETFETVGVEKIQEQGGIRVMTVLTTAKGDKVKLDYIMYAKGFGWQVVDIFLEGTVSEMARRATEYRKLLRASGLDGLTIALRERVLMQQAEF